MSTITKVGDMVGDMVSAAAAMQKSESAVTPAAPSGTPQGVGVVGGVDLSEIDLGELNASDLSASTDVVNPDITAVFPEPLPADDPSQDFFAAAKAEQTQAEKAKVEHAKAEQAKAQSLASEPDRRTSSMAVKGSTLAEAKAATTSSSSSSGSKNKKKKKKGGAAAQVQTKEGQGGDAAAVKRAELREKLQHKMMMKKEFGAKEQHLSRMGLSLDEIGEAVKEEASGKRVSSSKQDRVMEKAQKMFGGLLGNMDSKQRNYLSKKKEEVSGMVSDVFDRVLSGPKGKVAKGKSAKGKKKNTSAAQPAAPGGGKDQEEEDEVPELTPTLDPQLEDFVRGVHEKSNKSNKSNKSKSKPTEMPLRPRVGATASATAAATTAAAASTAAPPQQPTKNQLKNKRKRQKLKDKLKQLKPNPTTTTATTTTTPTSNPATASTAASAATTTADPVPQLVPVVSK